MSQKSIANLKVVHSNLVGKKNNTWQALDQEGATILDTGNSELYGTGKWVPKKLNFSDENCINCGLCWPVCPDDAILLDDKGNMIGVDLDHCKDCGMCVEICPANKNPDEKKHALFFKDDYREDF